MHVRIWELVGIIVVTLVLLWANRMLMSKWPTAQTIIYVLLVVLGVFLALASLGILPGGFGVSVDASPLGMLR